MINIFTPSFADEADTNAQNLTVKEIVARLCPDRFRVMMCCEGLPDPRISARRNTKLLRWQRHGNTPRALLHLLVESPEIYFFPREGPLDTAFFYLRKRFRLRTAVVSYIVSGGLDRAAPRPGLARNVRESDTVFGNCGYLSELIQRQLDVDVGTIYDGVDRRFFSPSTETKRDSPAESLTVLFAGSFRPYKRVDMVIRQAARWPDVRFRIAGQGEDEPACRALATQLHCRNVSFLGHLPLEQLGKEMRQADVFFFPSVVEGHPQVLGQAAACGLPCVAMSCYRPDYVIDGKTGFLATSDGDLEAKLDLLLTRPDLRRSMSEAGISHASQFDWDVVTAQWQDAFERVLVDRRSH